MTDDRPLALILNRSTDDLSVHSRHLDHDAWRAVYLAVDDHLHPEDRRRALAVHPLPAEGTGVAVDLAAFVAAQHGPVAAVVASSEYDVFRAARIREHLGVPGTGPDVARRFRDKVEMKRRVADAGLRTPPFLALTHATGVQEVLERVGLPAVVKPRWGAASQGVQRVDTPAELSRALHRVGPDHECEAFVAGSIHHVDGIRRDGTTRFASVSAYVNTCLDFALGSPLGSVLIDAGPRRERLVAFASAALDALGLVDGAFHLELIVEESGDPVFLEVGLRVGGGEIPFVHRDILGIDLIGEAVHADAGLPAGVIAHDRPMRAAGFVMVPEPAGAPNVVRSVTSMQGRVPGVVHEILPVPGTVLDGHGGYEHIGGRFWLAGRDERAVRRTIAAVLQNYRLTVEPCGAPRPTVIAGATDRLRDARVPVGAAVGGGWPS